MPYGRRRQYPRRRFGGVRRRFRRLGRFRRPTRRYTFRRFRRGMFRRGRLVPSAFTSSGLVTRKRWVVLRYCTVLALDLSLGSAIHVFRANGLYDPDYTGTGHQPFGRDKHALDFRKYIVTSSFASVTWMNTVGPLQVVGPFYLVSSDTYNDVSTNYAASGMDYMMESCDSKQRAYWGDPQNKKTRCYVRWKCPRPFDDLWASETSGDPTGNNQQYYTLLAHTIPAATPGGTAYFRVEIFYRTLFFDPRLVNASS